MMVQGRAEKVQQGAEEGGPERGADHGVRQARRGLQPRDTCLTVIWPRVMYPQVNGRKYTWSDAAHAVMDMMDNSVSWWLLYHKLVKTNHVHSCY